MSDDADTSRQPAIVDGDRRLRQILRWIAGVTMIAFAAAIMPERWIVETSEWLGFDPFPESPLTIYLARHLSAMYGVLGAVLWVITLDLDRYRPLIRYAAVGVAALGVLQLWMDWQAGMPPWWTWGESLSTIAGGGFLGWLENVTRKDKQDV